MMTLDRDAALFERERNLGAEVGERVGRRHRHVSLLVAYAVAEVRPAHVVLLAARTPSALVGVYAVAAVVRLGINLHAVEDEELRLGAEVDRVGDACEAQIALRALRDRARVEPVTLLRYR